MMPNNVFCSVLIFIASIILGRTSSIAQDGVLDTNFGDNGVFSLPNIGEDQLEDFIVLPNKKIIACGTAYGPFMNFHGLLTRLNPDGTIDSSFGQNGIANVSQFVDWSLHKIVVQSDGKILGVGHIGNYNFSIFRFHSNGQIDSSFGGSGFFSPNPNWQFGNGVAVDVAEMPNGEIIAVGAIDRDSSSVIVKLKQNGTLDSAFGTNGLQQISLWGNKFVANSFEQLDSNGAIIVCGTLNWSGTKKLCLVKANLNGTIDTTFGIKGFAFSLLNQNDFGKSIHLQNNRIMVIGSVISGTDTSIVSQRWLPNGKLDPTFFNQGQHIISVPGFSNAQPISTAIHFDGSLLISLKGGGNHGIARLYWGGFFDFRFANNGVFLAQSGKRFLRIDTLDRNNIIAVGSLKKPNAGVFAIAEKYSAIYHIGIPEINKASFNLFPNPTTDFIIVELPTADDIYIANALGKVMWCANQATKKVKIDMTNWPSGIYFLKTQNHGTQRFVKTSP